MSSSKEEYELEKKLIELEYKLQDEVNKKSHERKMKELNTEFDLKMQLQRFKSAAIKNTIDRKQDRSFMENYPR